jgi:hypothetical protein
VKRKDTLGKGQFATAYKYEQKDGVCDMDMRTASMTKDEQASTWNTNSFVIYEFITYPLGIKTL